MNAPLLAVLNDAERQLVAETEQARLGHDGAWAWDFATRQLLPIA
jgi:hypothetical protein